MLERVLGLAAFVLPCVLAACSASPTENADDGSESTDVALTSGCTQDSDCQAVTAGCCAENAKYAVTVAEARSIIGRKRITGECAKSHEVCTIDHDHLPDPSVAICAVTHKCAMAQPAETAAGTGIDYGKCPAGYHFDRYATPLSDAGKCTKAPLTPAPGDEGGYCDRQVHCFGSLYKCYDNVDELGVYHPGKCQRLPPGAPLTPTPDCREVGCTQGHECTCRAFSAGPTYVCVERGVASDCLP